MDCTCDNNCKDKYNILQEKFHILVELSNDGYWDWDLENPDYQYLSPRFKEILGYKDHEMPNTPESWRSVIDPDDLKLALDNSNKHLEDESFPYYQIVKYKHRNGKILDVLCRGAAIRRNGKPIRFVGTHTDLTKLKEIEREVERQRDLAEKASKSTKLFLANMSHEIRTPMNGIVGLIDLMKDDNTLSDKHKKYLDYVSRSTDILLKLLGDILEFSKLEALRVSLDAKVHRLSKIKDLTYETWKDKFKKKNIKFKFIISDSLPNEICIDSQRFLQVLNNLITNSYKYTDEGKVVITIRYENKQLIIKVKDTGVGIDDKHQDKILLPFERFCDNKIDGAGLGLSICNNIVNAFGGKIWFKSAPGIGSTFYFTYPNVCAGNKPINKPVKTIKRRKSLLRILVADDNNINRIVIQELLKNIPCIDFDIVESGEEAIEMVRKNEYDIIFMDIVMPGMGGEKAASIIKAEQDIKIVAMTANAISGDREKYLKTMDGYISKPMTIKNINSLLESLF